MREAQLVGTTAKQSRLVLAVFAAILLASTPAFPSHPPAELTPPYQGGASTGYYCPGRCVTDSSVDFGTGRIEASIIGAGLACPSGAEGCREEGGVSRATLETSHPLAAPASAIEYMIELDVEHARTAGLGASIEWQVTTFVDYVRSDSYYSTVSSGPQALTHNVQAAPGGIPAGPIYVWVGVSAALWPEPGSAGTAGLASIAARVVRIRATITD